MDSLANITILFRDRSNSLKRAVNNVLRCGWGWGGMRRDVQVGMGRDV